MRYTPLVEAAKRGRCAIRRFLNASSISWKCLKIFL
jgi:hypothetical protein